MNESVTQRKSTSFTSSRIFTIVGVAAITAGGLFSAATARGASYHSAWFVAYLVLVVGIAQVALGAGQLALAESAPSVALVVSELVLFNLGNTGVLAGTLLALPFLVDAGSVLLVVALALFVWGVRLPGRHGWALWGYRSLVVLLLVSVAIGVFFAHEGAP